MMMTSKPWNDPPSFTGKAFCAASIRDKATSADRAVATDEGTKAGGMKVGHEGRDGGGQREMREISTT